MVFPAVAVVGFARVIIFGLLTTILLCGDVLFCDNPLEEERGN